MKRLAVGFVAAALGAAASPAAFAGPVTAGSGSVEMSFQATSSGGAGGSQTFPVTLPGPASVSFDGGSGDPSNTFGHSTADYSLVDSADGGVLSVDLASTIPGEPTTAGSAVAFSLSFTTDRLLHYRLDASTDVAPSKTELRFDGFSATAQTDQFGTFSGDWPAVPGPGSSIREFTDVLQEGDLPAGTHTLFLAINTFMLRDGDGDSNEAGLRLALTAAGGGGPSPTPVPLPAAVWPGVAVLGGIFTATAARRRRVTP
jgi:hypothetical protein